MLIKLFKRGDSLVYLIILLLALVMWFPSFTGKPWTTFQFDYYPGFLYRVLQPELFSHKIFYQICSFLLLVILSLLLIRLNILFFFINTRTQLPALFFLVIVSSLFPLQRPTPVLISLLLFVFAIIRIFASYEEDEPAFHYFDAAILLSTGSLFYFNTFFFLPLLWISLILFRPFVWREWVFTIFGALLPYIFLVSMYYISGKDPSLVFSDITSQVYKPSATFRVSEYVLSFYVFLGIILMLSSFFMIKKYAIKKIQSRKFFVFFLYSFINSLFIYIFVPSAGLEIIYFTAISLSFLFTHYFINTHNTLIINLLFFITAFGGIIIRYYA